LVVIRDYLNAQLLPQPPASSYHQRRNLRKKKKTFSVVAFGILVATLNAEPMDRNKTRMIIAKKIG
jgi:hypothetical protein